MTPKAKDKLWVDDLRPAPDDTWATAKTSYEALEFLRSRRVPYKEISLDHDMGGDDTTMAVVDWLIWNVRGWPKDISIHTQNPVGRDNLIRTISTYAPPSVDIWIVTW